MNFEYSEDEFSDIDSDNELGTTILSKNQKVK